MGAVTLFSDGGGGGRCGGSLAKPKKVTGETEMGRGLTGLMCGRPEMLV